MPNNAPITKLGQQLGIHATQGTLHGPTWPTKCVTRDSHWSPMPAHSGRTWPATRFDENDLYHLPLDIATRHTPPLRSVSHTSDIKKCGNGGQNANSTMASVSSFLSVLLQSSVTIVHYYVAHARAWTFFLYRPCLQLPSPPYLALPFPFGQDVPRHKVAWPAARVHKQPSIMPSPLPFGQDVPRHQAAMACGSAPQAAVHHAFSSSLCTDCTP